MLAPGARRFGLLTAIIPLALCLASPARGAVTQRGDERQPRNITELYYSFEHTFAKILSPTELKLYRTRTPLQLKESHPDLYARISGNVVGWTDEWLEHLKATLDPLPPKKLDAAKRAAAQVDAALRAHFEARGWTYKPMRAIFLPPRLFTDERDRGSQIAGVFIPYYPDAFFASIDWVAPMGLVLMHESLHFNATTRPYGSSMEEGLTETAARHLVLKYELVDPSEVRRAKAYPLARKSVEMLIDEIIARRPAGRDEAVDLLLEAYVTGRQDRVAEVFGEDAWKRILGLAHSDRTWQTHRIKEALRPAS